MEPVENVLLTDGLMRKALAATRSLGRRGLRVSVGEKTRFHPAGGSKYCADRLLYPDPVEKPGDFLEWLLAYLQRARPTALFPMDDAVMDLAVAQRNEIERWTRAALPPAESYGKLRDKREGVKLAAAAGLRCPINYSYHGNLPPPLPAVIRPRVGSGSRGFRLARTPEEFQRYYQEIIKLDPAPLLQEYIDPGPRYGVNLLYDLNGRLKASFVQKETRGFPIPHGPSAVQESIHRPELVEMAVSVLKNAPWQGVLQFEFIEDAKNGQPVFLEVNTRFWNSLHLSVSCGVDFPWLLYRVLAGEQVPETHHYPAGIRCHSLLPSDFFYFLASKDRFRLDPPVWRVNSGGVQDDILAWEDLGAAAGFFLASLRYGLDPHMWQLLLRR